jgi:deoxyribonuclease V
MQPVLDHPWKLTQAEAEALQAELAGRVVTQDDFGAITSVAGVDVAYDTHSQRLVAAAVVLEANTLTVRETAVAEDIERFPYIPGLFSFRELPSITLALKQLRNRPDLIVCDGQGLAHPRRFGLACHLGVLFDIPAIGCGKTRLIGDAADPDSPRGAASPLMDGSEQVGSLLRTQTNVRPIYVSVGHRIGLASACDWILRLSPRYRLPETTRLADQLVNSRL